MTADRPMPDHDRASRLRGSGGYAATLIMGLLAAISVAVAATKPWVTVTAVQPNLPTLEVSVAGTRLSPLSGAMGLVMLAAFGAVVATRGRVRQALGLLVVAAAGLVLFLAIRPGDESEAVRAALSARGWIGGPYQTAASPWRWLVIAGAAVGAVAGVITVRFGGGWATMGSRYDAPRATEAAADEDAALSRSVPAESPPDNAASTRAQPLGAELSDADLWRALDRGHDPTQQP